MYMNGEQSMQNKATDNQDMSVNGSEKAFRLKVPAGFLIKNLLWICLIGELKVTTLSLPVVIVSDMAGRQLFHAMKTDVLKELNLTKVCLAIQYFINHTIPVPI